MQRNDARARRVVSCIFTCTEDLDAEFPAVAARRVGLDQSPLLCARELPVPGSLPRVIRTLVHYYADEGHEPKHVYLERGPHAARRPRPRPVTIEFASAAAPHPGLPGRRRLRAARGHRPAGLQRVAGPSAARGPRGGPARARHRQPLPRPVERAAAQPPRRPLRRPAPAHRHRQRLLRHPPRRRRGPARARRRGRLRLAELLRLSAPGGSVRRHARSGSRSTTTTATTSTAWPRRSRRRRASSSSATRTTRPRPRSPCDDIEAFLERIPRHVCVILDEAYCEFNLLDDPDASIGLLDRHANLVLLRTFSKVYGMAAFRVGFALCGQRGVPDGRRPGPPALLLQRRRPGRRGRGAAPPGRGRPPRRTRRRGAHAARRRAARAMGLKVADSQANFVWVHLPEDADEAEVMRGLAERGVLDPRRRRARARERPARHHRHRGRERALPARLARPPLNLLHIGVQMQSPPRLLHLLRLRRRQRRGRPWRSLVLAIYLGARPAPRGAAASSVASVAGRRSRGHNAQSPFLP